MDNQTKKLKDLIMAALIGEAEFDHFITEPVLKGSFDMKKSYYLADLIKNDNLKPFIEINVKKGQFTIHSHPILAQLKREWYRKNNKIFSMTLDPSLLSLESIVISINLFGNRKMESITISTSIEKDHIKGISFCIEQHLGVPVIPNSNSIKITNIPRFIIPIADEMPAIHSAELVNYLTDKEKKRIMEGA